MFYSSVGSGSSSILSRARSPAAAALASFFLFALSFNLSQRSRNRTIIALCVHDVKIFYSHFLRKGHACFSFSRRTTRTSSSNSRTRRKSCASRSRPGLRTPAATTGGDCGRTAGMPFRAISGTAAGGGGGGGGGGGMGGRCWPWMAEAAMARCA
jgi:hypothetical protein